MFGIPTYSSHQLDEYERSQAAEMSDAIDVRQALRDHELAPGTLKLVKQPDGTQYSLDGLVGIVGPQSETDHAMAIYADISGSDDFVSLFPMSEVHEITYEIDELEKWIDEQIDRMLEASNDNVPDVEPDPNLGY